MNPKNKYINTTVVIILSMALFLRIWRINTDLLVHYDQGRDLIAAYKIWKLHKPTLLGAPTDYRVSIPYSRWLSNATPVMYFGNIVIFIVARKTPAVRPWDGALKSGRSPAREDTPGVSPGRFILSRVSNHKLYLSLMFLCSGIAWQFNPVVGFGLLPFAAFISVKQEYRLNQIFKNLERI